jgi:hypothetical protein
LQNRSVSENQGYLWATGATKRRQIAQVIIGSGGKPTETLRRFLDSWNAKIVDELPELNAYLLILSATEVAGIHASIMVLCWVGIPLLRFHLHPSHRRSIGQTIGLTAYPPQRAAIFTMPPHSNLPRPFSVGSLIRAFGHPDHMWSLLTLAGLYDLTPNIPWMRSTFELQGLAYSTTKVGSLRSP